MTAKRPSVLVLSVAPAVVAGAVAVALGWPLAGPGQDAAPEHAKHAQQQTPAKSAETRDSFADQVEQLRDQVARLEAALSRGEGGGLPGPKGQPQGTGTGPRVGGKVPPGYRIATAYTDCLRCHQTIPSNPLPPSHLEAADISGGIGAAQPGDAMAAAKGSPSEQLQQLRDQVARLEAVVSQGKTAGSTRPMSQDRGMGKMRRGMAMTDDMGTGGAGMMEGMEMMGGGGMGAAGMGGAQGMGMGMSDDKGMEMTGMGAMGRARAMAGMTMGSDLPGFPGISHLYHIGADDFFLNHVGHITLTADQRKTLNQIKQKALLAGSSCAREVDEAEQELWELTASDQPDAAEVEAKVREIEQLRADQRLAFIRAVGEAAQVLTDEQRRALVGTAAEPPAPSRHAKH